MIHSHRLLFPFVLGVVLIFAISAHARAQQDKAAAENEAVAELREKAFKVLESVAGQLNTLQSVENRARMGSNLVDSLWKHDEERARSLLRMVQEDIKTELQKPDRPREANQRFEVFRKLRSDTIERVAKYDPQAALDFLRVTVPTFDEDAEPYGFRQAEQELGLRLARQVAADNPDDALKLARQSLENGVSMDTLAVLHKLNRKHKAQAQILYKEIVEKIRDKTDNDWEDWNELNAIQALVQAFAPPESDELMYRELIGILVTKAVELGCAGQRQDESERSYTCRWVASSVNGAERYDPRIAKIKQWATDAYGGSQRFIFTLREVEDLLKAGAYDQIEELALKNPDAQADIYLRAINYSMVSGNSAQSRKLIDRLFINDPESRKLLLARVEQYEKRSVVNDQKLADIQKTLAGPMTVRTRIGFLMTQADVLGNSDRNVALKLLNQASDLIEAMTPGKEQTEMRIYLALMYATNKSDRGFAIMESLLPKLNELVDIAVKLDGYDTNYLRDGEWNMSASGVTGELLTKLSEQAGRFAWCDFDRAVSLASQFERPEIRLMAQLKLAQSILAGPPKSLTQGY